MCNRVTPPKHTKCQVEARNVGRRAPRAAERDGRHGGFPNVSAEALEMIAHKIARILNGDLSYPDSWHDIAGYALRVEARLRDGEARGNS